MSFFKNTQATEDFFNVLKGLNTIQTNATLGLAFGLLPPIEVQVFCRKQAGEIWDSSLSFNIQKILDELKYKKPISVFTILNIAKNVFIERHNIKANYVTLSVLREQLLRDEFLKEEDAFNTWQYNISDSYTDCLTKFKSISEIPVRDYPISFEKLLVIITPYFEKNNNEISSLKWRGYINEFLLSILAIVDINKVLFQIEPRILKVVLNIFFQNTILPEAYLKDNIEVDKTIDLSIKLLSCLNSLNTENSEKKVITQESFDPVNSDIFFSNNIEYLFNNKIIKEKENELSIALEALNNNFNKLNKLGELHLTLLNKGTSSYTVESLYDLTSGYITLSDNKVRDLQYNVESISEVIKRIIKAIIDNFHYIIPIIVSIISVIVGIFLKKLEEKESAKPVEPNKLKEEVEKIIPKKDINKIPTIEEMGFRDNSSDYVNLLCTDNEKGFITVLDNLILEGEPGYKSKDFIKTLKAHHNILSSILKSTESTIESLKLLFKHNNDAKLIASEFDKLRDSIIKDPSIYFPYTNKQLYETIKSEGGFEPVFNCLSVKEIAEIAYRDIELVSGENQDVPISSPIFKFWRYVAKQRGNNQSISLKLDEPLPKERYAILSVVSPSKPDNRSNGVIRQIEKLEHIDSHQINQLSYESKKIRDAGVAINKGLLGMENVWNLHESSTLELNTTVCWPKEHRGEYVDQRKEDRIPYSDIPHQLIYGKILDEKIKSLQAVLSSFKDASKIGFRILKMKDSLNNYYRIIEREDSEYLSKLEEWKKEHITE